MPVCCITYSAERTDKNVYRKQTIPRELIPQLMEISKNENSFLALIDACNLGIIHGKRLVRRKKKN